MMTTIPMRIAMLVVFCLLLVGCSGSDARVTGAECANDRDCASGSICLTGSDYPDGLCTVECDRNTDCPRDMACIDEEGGVCLFWCEDDRDCPGGWECERERLRERDDRESVCIGD